MIMMREMRRKRTDIAKETTPLVIGRREGLYSGARNVRIIVRGTHT